MHTREWTLFVIRSKLPVIEHTFLNFFLSYIFLLLLPQRQFFCMDLPHWLCIFTRKTTPLLFMVAGYVIFKVSFCCIASWASSFYNENRRRMIMMMMQQAENIAWSLNYVSFYMFTFFCNIFIVPVFMGFVVSFRCDAVCCNFETRTRAVIVLTCFVGQVLTIEKFQLDVAIKPVVCRCNAECKV